MSALPRPDISPGAHRDLVDALHDLHHRAGWPSLRRMAAAVGTSHTTVSKTFSHPALPAWGTLELLVETLGGDVSFFHDLWSRASAPDGPVRAPRARIAGRRAELASVRRHLERGAGLMVVAGEAGIGKTKLVVTAAQSSDTFVAVGHCLPLSAQAPLMPVAAVLRAIHDLDDGERLRQAIAACPAYVSASLARLLPELGEATSAETDDEFSRHRLFAAVTTCLSRVHERDNLGVLVEDVHWADTATLDLLEHLVAAGSSVPIVATWRLEDPDTDEPQREWWNRMRRLSTVTALELSPLTRDESEEQCRLLGLDLDDAALDLIHGRSRGQPLFTEQLATHVCAGTDLPEVLADLLDRRLERLDESAYVITRALGVADRGLSPEVVAAVTGLAEEPLHGGLRELTRAHLLAASGPAGDVQLRHPLLAEAARRRLVAGEGVAVHRRLAEALGAEPGASAAEVAEHWRGAGDAEQELEWRIIAARGATAQWAASQAAEHWLRALDVWPDEVPTAGDPPLGRPEAYLAAMDALKDSLQFDRAAALSDDTATQFPDLEPALRAEFLRRAAVFRTEIEGPAVGLELVEEAIAILSSLPMGVGLVRALARKHQVLIRMGRFAEALDVAHAAIAAAEAADDRMSQRLMRAHVAWHEAVIDGDMIRASETIARARALSSAVDDPSGEIWLAVIWTDVLLILGAGCEAVVSEGQGALALAEERGIADFGPVLVRYNMVRSLIDAGRLVDASALLGPVASLEVDFDRAPTFIARALLDLVAGRLDEAIGTIDVLRAGMPGLTLDDLDVVCVIAVVELWCDRAWEAWSVLLPALEAQVEAMPVALLLPPLVLAARAVADLAARGATDAETLRARVVDLHRRATIGRSTPAGAALAATWSAEVARVEGADSMRAWLTADSQWDTLGRPHEAAYCRWRAGQAAIRDGRGTVASRLLTRAALEARGHKPLAAAIEATRSRGPGVSTAPLRGSAAPP